MITVKRFILSIVIGIPLSIFLVNANTKARIKEHRRYYQLGCEDHFMMIPDGYDGETAETYVFEYCKKAAESIE